MSGEIWKSSIRDPFTSEGEAGTWAFRNGQWISLLSPVGQQELMLSDDQSAYINIQSPVPGGPQQGIYRLFPSGDLALIATHFFSDSGAGNTFSIDDTGNLVANVSFGKVWYDAPNGLWLSIERPPVIPFGESNWSVSFKSRRVVPTILFGVLVKQTSEPDKPNVHQLNPFDPLSAPLAVVNPIPDNPSTTTPVPEAVVDRVSGRFIAVGS